jgi:hypothetical protein
MAHEASQSAASPPTPGKAPSGPDPPDPDPDPDVPVAPPGQRKSAAKPRQGRATAMVEGGRPLTTGAVKGAVAPPRRHT